MTEIKRADRREDYIARGMPFTVDLSTTLDGIPASLTQFEMEVLFIMLNQNRPLTIYDVQKQFQLCYYQIASASSRIKTYPSFRAIPSYGKIVSVFANLIFLKLVSERPTIKTKAKSVFYVNSEFYQKWFARKLELIAKLKKKEITISSIPFNLLFFYQIYPYEVTANGRTFEGG